MEAFFISELRDHDMDRIEFALLGFLMIEGIAGVIVNIIMDGAHTSPRRYAGSCVFGVVGAMLGAYGFQLIRVYESTSPGAVFGAVFGATMLALWDFIMLRTVDDI